MSIWSLVLISFLHITIGGAFSLGFLFYICAENSLVLSKFENKALFTLLIVYTASLLVSIGLAIYFYIVLNSESYYLCFSLSWGLLILLLGYWTCISVRFS
jgi:hypothetical protein